MLHNVQSYNTEFELVLTFILSLLVVCTMQQWEHVMALWTEKCPPNLPIDTACVVYGVKNGTEQYSILIILSIQPDSKLHCTIGVWKA